MGLHYGTPFLAGHGLWKRIQAIRSAGLPVDLFLPSTEDGVTVYDSTYISDVSVRFFQFAAGATNGGSKPAHIVEFCLEFQRYAATILGQFSVAIMCFDAGVFVPPAKRPLQVKRRAKHKPLTGDERKELFEDGIIRDWNRVRSTPGAMAWVLKHLKAFISDGFEMPPPKASQSTTTLIIHGLADEPHHATMFEATKDSIEKTMVETNIIGEGEIQVAYWMSFMTSFMPVVGVSIDKDLIALALISALRKESGGHPMYTFRHRSMFPTFVTSPPAVTAFKHRPYRSCPDFTSEPMYSPKAKITQLPFLDILGFRRELEMMFAEHNVRVTSPQATWVLFIAFVGCDFVDKNVLRNLNGEKLFEGYLALGEQAPSVIRVTLDDPDAPFVIEFAEKVFLEFVFAFLETYNRNARKPVRFDRKRVKVAARQVCWVVSYWCNATLGHDFVPDSIETNSHGKSYWGWIKKNGVVKEAADISKTLPEGHTLLVDSLKVRQKRSRAQTQDEEPLVFTE